MARKDAISLFRSANSVLRTFSLAMGLFDRLGKKATGMRMIPCRKCKKPNLTTNTYCIKCGISLHPKQCASCGAAAIADAMFCSVCGKQLIF